MAKYELPRNVNDPGLCFMSYLRCQTPRSYFLMYQKQRKDFVYALSFTVVCLVVALVVMAFSV